MIRVFVHVRRPAKAPVPGILLRLRRNGPHGLGTGGCVDADAVRPVLRCLRACLRACVRMVSARLSEIRSSSSPAIPDADPKNPAKASALPTLDVSAHSTGEVACGHVP